VTPRAVPRAQPVGPGLWRLALSTDTLPPFDHVNTYLIVSNGVAAVVDPGSSAPDGAEAVTQALDALGVRLVRAILLTHGHHDHVAGLEDLSDRLGRPTVYLHAREAGRVAHATSALDDDRRIAIGDVVVRALHTPGHSPGHLSFLLENDGAALVGDLVAGEGSTWIGVPEGDVTDYLASLRRLRGLAPRLLGPGHGPVRTDAADALAAAAAHREARERAVLQRLERGTATLAALRAAVYPAVPEAAVPFVEATLLAHLHKLIGEMRVSNLGEGADGPYARRR